MARSAAAARAPRTHAPPARRTPSRRASGRAERNAQALRESAGAHKSRTAKAAPNKSGAKGAARLGQAARKGVARIGHAARNGAVRPRGPARGGAVAHAGTVALPLPLRVIRAPFTRGLRSRSGGVLDALLQGRGWIALIAVLLVGIVFFNVDLLKINHDIATTSQRASNVERENGRLRLEVAKLDGSERVQTAAAAHGLVLPAPGDVRYLRANPFEDARRASKLIEAPGSSASAPEPTPQTTAPQTASPQATSPPGAAPQSTTPQPAAPTPAAQTPQPQAAPAAPAQTQAQPGATTTAPAG